MQRSAPAHVLAVRSRACLGSLALLALSLSLAGCPSRPDAASSPAAPSAAPPAAATNRDSPVFDGFPAPSGLPSLDAAETAATARPDDAQARKTLGLAYYAAHDGQNALKALTEAAKKLPKDAVVQRYLAYTQLALGNKDEALATFRRLIGMASAPKALRSQAALEMGSLLWQGDKLDEAARAFEQSLTLDPQQGMAALGLGIWAAQKGNRDAAHKHLETAAKLLPPGSQRARAFAALGRLREEQKDSKGAFALYQKAVEQDPENEWAAGRLAAQKIKKATAAASSGKR